MRRIFCASGEFVFTEKLKRKGLFMLNLLIVPFLIMVIVFCIASIGGGE